MGMNATAATQRRWFVLTSNKLEQTTLVRLLAGGELGADVLGRDRAQRHGRGVDRGQQDQRRGAGGDDGPAGHAPSMVTAG